MHVGSRTVRTLFAWASVVVLALSVANQAWATCSSYPCPANMGQQCGHDLGTGFSSCCTTTTNPTNCCQYHAENWSCPSLYFTLTGTSLDDTCNVSTNVCSNGNP